MWPFASPSLSTTLYLAGVVIIVGLPVFSWTLVKSQERICQLLDASLEVQRDTLRRLEALDNKASQLVDLVMEHRPPHVR
jgi:hypothetical protein